VLGCPLQHQNKCPSRQAPLDDFQGSDVDQGFILAIERMKMGRCMVSPEHLDYYSIKKADRGHVKILFHNPSEIKGGPRDGPPLIFLANRYLSLPRLNAIFEVVILQIRLPPFAGNRNLTSPPNHLLFFTRFLI